MPQDVSKYLNHAAPSLSCASTTWGNLLPAYLLQLDSSLRLLYSSFILLYLSQSPLLFMASTDATHQVSRAIKSQRSNVQAESHCPLRHMSSTSSPWISIREILHKGVPLPPSHAICVARFRQNEHLMGKMDEKFGTDGDQMLLSLLKTHECLFETVDEVRGSDAINDWLGRVETPRTMPK